MGILKYVLPFNTAATSSACLFESWLDPCQSCFHAGFGMTTNTAVRPPIWSTGYVNRLGLGFLCAASVLVLVQVWPVDTPPDPKARVLPVSAVMKATSYSSLLVTLPHTVWALVGWPLRGHPLLPAGMNLLVSLVY